MSDRWQVYRVTAGDRRAEWTREQKIEAAKRGEDIGTDPVYAFLVAVPADAESFFVPIETAWNIFSAQTSDDLPKPFNMVVEPGAFSREEIFKLARERGVLVAVGVLVKNRRRR